MTHSSLSRGLSRVLRHPLLHFLALGLLIQLAGLGDDPPGRDSLHISATRISELAADWQRRHGQPPAQDRLRSLVEQYIDEELLVRRAHSLGLDRNNPTVRSILLANLRYAGFETETDAELLQLADQLGLAANDPLVRRYLVETMRLLWARPVNGGTAAKAAAVPGESLFSFEQYFFASESEAREHLRQLSQGGSASPRGAAFALGHRFSARSSAQITAQLGPSLARAVAAAPPGEWLGPVASAWGWHLLRVDDARPAVQPNDLAHPAARLLQSQRTLKARLAEVRRQTEIRIDWPDNLDGWLSP